MSTNACNFDDVLLTPEFLADPYAVYHQMRSEAPVYWSERFKAWMLTRYADVKSTLHDPRMRSRERIGAILSQLPESARAEMKPLSDHLTKWVAFTDPPDHTRLRTLVDKAFTPRMIANLRRPIQSIVDELLVQVAHAGRMDVVQDFSFPLPATVISSMLGIPRADHGRFKKWSGDIANFVSAGGINIDVARQAQQSVIELADYFQGIIRDRRQTPQDDLISRLVAAEEQGEKLSEDELFAMFVQLFFAGHETTTGLINNGLLALLRNPEQKRKLQNDPTLIASAVEEFLRYDTSVQRQARVAAEDIEIDGHTIRKGQYVLQFIAAANRDPAVFPNPDTLDVARTGNRHLAFGYGSHFCIGGPLARLEGQIAMGTLLQRMPNIELACEVATLEWEPLMALRKLKLFPVTF
jgi:pimeloyl-[acyl-carrier protein] synthase